MEVSKIKLELIDTIFARASERHGTAQNDLHLWYRDVEIKLLHLMQNEYAQDENRLAQEAVKYRKVVERLLSDTTLSKLLTTEEKRVLRKGLAVDLKAVNQRLETFGLSFMDLMIFYQIADFGRKVFRTEGKRENDFILGQLFALVQKIYKNFPAYKATLQSLQA